MKQSFRFTILIHFFTYLFIIKAKTKNTTKLINTYIEDLHTSNNWESFEPFFSEGEMVSFYLYKVLLKILHFRMDSSHHLKLLRFSLNTFEFIKIW